MGEPIPWTVDQVEWLFHAALKAGDGEGVEAAIRVMLTVDRQRAVDLWDALQAALLLAGAGR